MRGLAASLIRLRLSTDDGVDGPYSTAS